MRTDEDVVCMEYLVKRDVAVHTHIISILYNNNMNKQKKNNKNIYCILCTLLECKIMMKEIYN